jgi:farnesyl diphosphate synthase
MSAQTFSDWMADIQRRTEAALERCLPLEDIAPSRLHRALRYATLGGGKRVRPLLCHAAGAASGASTDTLDTLASALELIHVYSLVHDDLPCMDDDTLRRGKPTCHIEFDEATALLVGDALQSLAFEQLAKPGLLDPARQLAMIELLARASGSRGMAGGQAIDLQSVGQTLTLAELEFMHLHKTGALIRAAVLLGFHAGAGAKAEEEKHIEHFGNCIGLLFQVVDDILDASTPTATLGKTAGKDAACNKPTYVSLMGLPGARGLCRDLAEEARHALAPFGERAARLDQLCDYLITREF